MDPRGIRIVAGLWGGVAVGVVWLAVGQPWFLALSVGLIAGDVIYALLVRIQTGEWGPIRVAAGLVAFAVATYIGIGFVDFGTKADVDPNTFINPKAANSWALILTIAMVSAPW